MGKKKPERDRKKTKTKTLKKPVRRKVCPFCASKVDDLDYKDVNNVKRYVNEKNKIAARRVTGTCANHQRMVAAAIKSAREMALIPYCTTR